MIMLSLSVLWLRILNHWIHQYPSSLYAVKAQTSLAPLSWFRGSHVTTAHAHQCCIFQSYAKTVPSRMKLTMREPAFMGSMTTDTWSRFVTSDFNRVLMLCNLFVMFNSLLCVSLENLSDFASNPILCGTLACTFWIAYNWKSCIAVYCTIS